MQTQQPSFLGRPQLPTGLPWHWAGQMFLRSILVKCQSSASAENLPHKKKKKDATVFFIGLFDVHGLGIASAPFPHGPID